jgi:hypothetical protein
MSGQIGDGGLGSGKVKDGIGLAVQRDDVEEIVVWAHGPILMGLRRAG